MRRFLAEHEQNLHLVVRELCRTRGGRSIERIHLGKLDGLPEHSVLLTCRHHSCESVASYVLEGMMAAVLADTDDGAWFRKNAKVLAVPFMDKDGVEEGDQGKNRKPRDHGRDYESIHDISSAVAWYVSAAQRVQIPHSQRHILQILEIKANPCFPGK